MLKKNLNYGVSRGKQCICVRIYAPMLDAVKNTLGMSWLSEDLEGKVKWLDNFQKFEHLQEIIVCPLLWDRDKRFCHSRGIKRSA